MDIGQPKDFITGTSMYLDYVKKTSSDNLADGVQFKSPVLVVSNTDDVLKRVIVASMLLCVYFQGLL